MLNEGFLATTAFYASMAHQNYHIDKYLKATDKAFGQIASALKNNNLKKELKGDICHASFRRLT